MAEYQLVRDLPESLLASLPTVEALESELDSMEIGASDAPTGTDKLFEGKR